ncbi:MAG: DUF4474 domain-containing protein [Clostridia bacterium]|nr:DUF4474 domain-containing protein [Clostridia bacterium]
MKRFAVKLTAILLVLIFSVSGALAPTVFAVEEITDNEIISGENTENTTPEENPEDTPEEKPEETPVLVLSADRTIIAAGEKTQIVAKVSGVDGQPAIVWASSNSSVAAVNKEGVVYGLGQGKATIYATVTVNGQTLRGEYEITVTASKNFVRDFLEGQQVLSYQYSYVDDYYYTNDKEAWQYNFGFGKIYDVVSPYVLLEYDYVRVFFTYEDKDWMLQMWKGQYGLIFYGGEIGIYNRPHADDGLPEWTFFNCPAEEDWLDMEMTLWHEQLDGSWKREFSREYDKYWWCTGFKNGHLRQEEPADELRLTGRITFKDEEMADIVAKGLAECGFKNAPSKDEIGLDQIYLDGKDISFCWQNISDAESTMAIKVIGGAMTAWTFITFLPLLVPFMTFYLTVFGFAAQFVSIIL